MALCWKFTSWIHKICIPYKTFIIIKHGIFSILFTTAFYIWWSFFIIRKKFWENSIFLPQAQNIKKVNSPYFDHLPSCKFVWYLAMYPEIMYINTGVCIYNVYTDSLLYDKQIFFSRNHLYVCWGLSWTFRWIWKQVFLP